MSVQPSLPPPNVRSTFEWRGVLFLFGNLTCFPHSLLRFFAFLAHVSWCLPPLLLPPKLGDVADKNAGAIDVG
jgi:hypothetical protein